MKSKKKRIAMAPALILIVSVTLLSGCSHTDPTTMEIFVADMLRNAASALLL